MSEEFDQIRIRPEQKEVLDKVKNMENVSSYHKALDHIIEESSYTDKFERVDELFERILQEVPNGKKDGKKDKFERIKALIHQTIQIDNPEEYKKNRGYLPENYKNLFLDDGDDGLTSKEGKELMEAEPHDKSGVK